MKQLLKTVLLQLLLLSPIKAIDFDWIKDLKGENSGHTVCQFLTLPHSAVSIATGLSSFGGAKDATDVPFFTSNTALADRYRFAMTHVEWFMGLRKEYLGGYFPVMDVGTIGFYSQIFTPGSIGHARTIDETPSHPKVYEYSIGASFARQLFANTLSAGGTISFLESHLDECIGRAVTGNLDILYTPLRIMSAHLYFANIGNSVRYEVSKESLPSEAGLSLQFNPLSEVFIDKHHTSWSAGIGVRKIADQPVNFGINTELRIFDMIAIRSGYEHAYGREFSAEGLGAGVSFQKGKYGIDGGWRYESEDLGFIWSASLRLQLEEILPKNAEQYYNTALKHYKKGRQTLCKYYAEKALTLDPDMWKAYALINQINSDVLRKSNLEIGLIYTGNINGNFAQPIEKTALGGLARMATVVKSLQSQFPVSLTVDAGNLVSAISDKSRIAVAGKFINRVNYDIIGGGCNEINCDLDKVYSNLDIDTKKHYLLANSLYTQSIVRREEIIEKEGYRISITSLVNESLIDSVYRNYMSPLMESDIISHDAKKCDLRIAIVHDSWQNIRRNIALFKGMDVIIAGNLEQSFQAPMILDSIPVLSAGVNGNYAGNLILRFNKDKQLISVRNRLIPLSDDIKPDSVIDEAMKQISANVQPHEKSLPDSLHMKAINPDGVFFFMSDRNGVNQIFLKIIDQNAEFPISGKKADVFCPVISYPSAQAAFIEKTDSSHNCTVVNYLNQESRRTPDSLFVNNIAATPDGKWLYLSAATSKNGQVDIIRQRFEGGPFFPVVHSDSSSKTIMAFSEKENLMVFGSYESGYHELYLSNQEGETPHIITQAKSDNFSPQFSPDGKKIAYLSDRSNFGGKLDIWVYNRSSGAHDQITSHSNVKEFCWLPDSRSIVFSSGVNVFSLYKVVLNPYRFSTLIKRDTAITFNERSPRVLRLKKQDMVLYTREYEDGTRKIFITDTDGSIDQDIIIGSGNDWLPDYRK